jgi:hypothetical protein
MAAEVMAREFRSPSQKLIKKLPQKQGNFAATLKVELWPAWQWSAKFSGLAAKRKDCSFFKKESDWGPWMPVNIYQESKAVDYYRISINGKFYTEEGHQYEFWTEDKAYELLKGEDHA